uniref:VWFD domain-containing protein n=1 Tax=Leptobrachium leishanense TaxID=445787 RepID=A0A8C5WLY9_9ANUR
RYLKRSTGDMICCSVIAGFSLHFPKNCMFDTCNCAKSEECMCAALSSYVYACARQGITLSGWRQNACSNCPKTLSYSYSISTCQQTCRSLSEHDITCDISFVPVDGCVCQNGTYLDDSGVCVLPTSCPCYYKGSAVPPGEVVHDNGALCTSCVSGCVCPYGLVADEKGGCIQAEDCPCIHNNEIFAADSSIKVKCNTCKCVNRNWICSGETCLGTCTVYGDGHFLTFDNKGYNFNGDCEYTLDYCSSDSTAGTFRIITQNIPCGSTGTTCSKSIKNYELILSDEKLDVVQRDVGEYVPYKLHQMGIYLVIEAANGLVLVWDKKTTIFIKLEPTFQGKVCGLCGNYDGNANNDFMTRSFSVVGDVLEFGNSWKLSPSCLDAANLNDPCSSNPYRKSWAQRQCSIITSEAFSTCHPLVDPVRYYDICVNDACACDTGGDCECFCTAVASYAQACSEAGVCVSWRSPNVCRELNQSQPKTLRCVGPSK